MLAALITKELRELWRDKRSLLATFAYALFGPLVLFIVIKGVISLVVEDTELNVILVGETEQVQYVQQYLQYRQLDVEYFDSNVEQALATLESDNAAVLISVDTLTTASGTEHYQLSLYADTSTTSGNKRMQKAASILNAFVNNEKQTNLLQFGLDPKQSKWQLQTFTISEQSASARRFLDSLLIFLLLSPFIITLNYINDATAGERERGSLMPLLSQPVPRSQIVIGKWLVGSALGIVGMIVTMYLSFSMLGRLPVYELDLVLHDGLPQLVNATLIMIPLALLVCSVQMLLALTAKTYKEGQSYLTMFSFMPMLIVFLSDSINQHIDSAWLPLLGHQQILQNIFSNQSVNSFDVAGLGVICLLLTFACLMLVRHQLFQESLVQSQ
ncbi:ABC transporter permease [Thalassotalea litorea]|uniref:ABC transporter permease n=1 Tax=Thalassotalea litorea TaxID=2020715 RepID=A0A5R9IR78_9GAMM|nr:ABC transporter permease [Thalassotalea litorea]TLU65801.1 ABC transporter permease [Thalassotalea litorea]